MAGGLSEPPSTKRNPPAELAVSQVIAASVLASPDASAVFWNARLPEIRVPVSLERSSAMAANPMISSAISTTISAMPAWRGRAGGFAERVVILLSR